MFVPKQRGQPRVGRAHGVQYSGVDVDAQRQAIDEHPQCPVSALAALHAPHQHRAEHHALLAGRRRQHPRPRQMNQACDADTGLARLMAQTLIHVCRQRLLHFVDAASVALHFLQTERQSRLVDVRQLLAEECLVLLLADAQSRLRHIVAIRHRRRQRHDVPRQTGLQLAAHHFEGDVVHRQVMEQQNPHHPAQRRIRRIHQTHQRRLTDVEAITSGVEARVQLLEDRPVKRIKFDFLQRQQRVAPHHLHRRGQAFPDHRRAQNIVARHDLAQRRSEGLDALATVERQLRLQQVRIALRGGDVVVENAFLQRRQRINVLHVGRPARHRGDDPLDVRLLQLHQRQHRRSDVRATGDDAIGRHLDFAPAADRGGQRRKGRLTEQHAHVTAQIELTHALDQNHRQQRMPAQLEEMVVTPDALDLQHFCPDLRQGDFDLALRRLVFAADQVVRARDRQCLAIHLTVGGQWQRRQTHVGARQHGAAQASLQVRVQLVDVQRRLLGKPRQQLTIAHQHHGLAHRRMAGKCALDFPRFDTHATDFHLIVVAPQILQSAVGTPACEVASSIQPRPRFVAERIAQEAFGGQVRTVQVTTSHPGPADVQLAGHAQRHRLLLLVEQIHRGVAHWLAEVQRLPRVNAPGGRHHRGFGRAVVVDHRERLLARELPQAITTDQQRAQGRVIELAVERVFGDRGRQKTDVQRLRTPPVEQRIDVFVAIAGGRQVQDRAHAQRRPDLPGHRVKTEPGEARGMAAGIQVENVSVPIHQVAQGPVLDHYPFGQAGGAGGVNHVGEVCRGQCGHSRRAEVGGGPGLAIKLDHRHRQRWQMPA
ncbi:hypothetical protein PseAD21_19140 [Pseudomonas sp. AD21]|nr:hypothetical protein PseAD21_19140 [Pseudomonas sp. AD21]